MEPKGANYLRDSPPEAIGQQIWAGLVLQDMDPHHSDNMTSMNLNMYPSTEGHAFPPGAQRIWSHTDYEVLTLLFQKPGELFLN